MNTKQLMAIGVLFSLGVAASAQPADPMKEDALSGPSVKEGGVPGDAKSFSGGPGRRREGDRPLAHRVFLDSLNVLRGEKADAAAKLTPAQEKSLRELERSFQGEMRAYFEKNKDQVMKARETLGLKGEMNGEEGFRRGVEEIRKALQKDKKAPVAKTSDTPAEDSMMSDEAMNEEREKARTKLQQIYSAAPKPGDVHTREWALLTETQQEIVSKEIDRLRTQEEEDRKSYLGKRDTLKKELEDVIAGKKELDPNDPRLPDKMREKLAAMTPDQRREAARRFLEERGKKKEGGEKKEAPKMDDVTVPTPDDGGDGK
jgi:hypothetical protein